MSAAGRTEAQSLVAVLLAPLVVPNRSGAQLPRGVIEGVPRTTPSGKRVTRGLHRPLTQRAAALTNALSASPEFFPSDLRNGGGAVVTSAVQHAVFVNCPESCWGEPTLFLERLGRSKMIHLVDQYVGQQGDDRYTVGSSLPVKMDIRGTLGMNDVLNIVHDAAAKIGGHGYGEIYHIFFPKDVKLCDSPNSCYAPLDPDPSFSTWCSLHNSAYFPDLGRVLYTVQMYQTGNCAERDTGGVFPNGVLVDSTVSLLSHELFETITDPDPDTDTAPGGRIGWQAVSYYKTLGDEMGDLCEAALDSQREHFVTSLDGHDYSIQLEYSNASHSCTNGE